MKNILLSILPLLLFKMTVSAQTPLPQSNRISFVKEYSHLLDLSKVRKECSRDSILYDSLSFYFKQMENDIPNQIRDFYENQDSLSSEIIIENYIQSQLSYIRDDYYQRAAMANTAGIALHVADSIDLCLLCLDIIWPDNSEYLLEEDKPKVIQKNIENARPDSSGFLDYNVFNSFQLEEDKWYEYTGSFWVKASWDSGNERTEWIDVPAGTQICDLEYNESGRGNHKVKLMAYSPILDSTSDTKLVHLTVTARADGANEWGDQKSALCEIELKRIRLIPLHYTQSDRESLGCKAYPTKRFNKDWALNKMHIPFDLLLLQYSEKVLTIDDINTLPDTYPY